VDTVPVLWFAMITSSWRASSKMASSPPATPSSVAARSSTAWNSFDSSNSAERSVSVSSNACCSSARRRSASSRRAWLSSSRARAIAMLACSAAAVRISKSCVPNAFGSVLSTATTPIGFPSMMSGRSTSDPLLSAGR
jgi:hypothetical protein